MGSGRSVTAARAYEARLNAALSVNPNYNQGRDYRVNCQSCASAFEAQMRGLDVEAVGQSEQDIFWFDIYDEKAKTIGGRQDKIAKVEDEEAAVQAQMDALRSKHGSLIDLYLSPDNAEYRRLEAQANELWGKRAELIQHQDYLSGFNDTTTPSSLKAIENQVKEWGNGARGVVCVGWKNNRGYHIFNVVNENGKAVGYDAQDGSRNVLTAYIKDASSDKIWLTRVDNKGVLVDELPKITRRR